MIYKKLHAECCFLHEDVVDIETVEEVRQGMAIAKMKEAVRRALRESR